MVNSPDSFSDYLTFLQQEAVRLAECFQRLEVLGAFSEKDWGEIEQGDFVGENDHLTPESLQEFQDEFLPAARDFWDEYKALAYRFLRQPPIRNKG